LSQFGLQLLSVVLNILSLGLVALVTYILYKVGGAIPAGLVACQLLLMGWALHSRI
jgi:hypothetical protein